MDNDFIKLQDKGSKPWGFWATGVLCACMAVIVFGTLLALFGYDSVFHVITAAGAEDPLPFALGYLIASPLVIGCCILFCRLRKGFTFREYVGFQRPKTKPLWFWLGITAVIVTGMDLSEHGSSYEVTMSKSASFMSLLGFTLIAVFLAPLTEEIVFRGFAFKGLWHSIGPVGTVLLTAFIFSLIHMQRNFVAHAMIFILAILLGIARIRTRSLYVPILMHLICNLIGMMQIWYWFAQQNG